MAINFVTGLPRHGKTLWTIVAVKERAEREKRQVYTCNIPGISIPGWLDIEHPDLWLTVPHGSIIIVDELQDFWQKEASGQRVPGPILELSKHGKRGIDFYFITQEPNLVHATPRDLCQHHYYVVRAFGSHNATVRKFERMQLHPEKVKKSGDMTPWRYPKDAFGWYKSADVHNIKRSIPFKLKMIPVVLGVVALCIWGAVKFAAGTLDKAKQSGGTAAALNGAQPGPSVSPGQIKPAAPLTPAEFVATFTPRLEGLPQTAPRYDELTKPTTVPYPAACLHMGSRCECFTQQATKLPVPMPLCLQIVKGGFFQDWGQALQQANSGQSAPSVVQTGAVPVVPAYATALPAPVVPAALAPAQHLMPPKARIAG